MIKNFITTNFRQLWKNRSQTIVNVLGLSLGITSVILIFLVLQFEYSFDTYHPDVDRLYRVVWVKHRFGETSYSSGSTYPLPAAIRQDFPELEHVTITDSNFGDPVISAVRADGSLVRFKEPKVTYVDPDYFQMFRYNWIHGNPDVALSTEKTVVLSSSIAIKYFETTDVVGKVIHFDNAYVLTVSGVVTDPPANTDLPFNIIISNKLGADAHGWDDWDSRSSTLNCYVKLRPDASPEDLNAKMKGWHVKYYDNKEDAESNTFFLQPMSEVHFDTRFTNFNSRVVSSESLLALALIGILLISTACINFVNLNTVLISNRSREVGVRKVLGSSRAQLLFQFIGETFSIALLSTAISTGLVELALLEVAPLLGFNLKFNLFSNWTTLAVVLSLPVLITLVAGIYPALSIASFQPIAALKKKLAAGFSDGIALRRLLIGVQLAISQALIICTLIIFKQMNFFMSQPMGLNSSSVVEFELPVAKDANLDLLKERILQIPGVSGMTISNTGSTSPETWGGNFKAFLSSGVVEGHADVKFVDEDFIGTYQLEMLAGSEVVKSDTVDRFVVNEAFVAAMGLPSHDEALGIPVRIWGRSAPIAGVVKNFNSSSLHSEIGPVVIMYSPRYFQLGGVRLNTLNSPELMTRIEAAWKDFFPKHVFEYQYLDETIKGYYDRERRTSRLLSLFSSVAIVIGCIGLFGLVSFMVTAKTKEVGIRKALGATVPQIITIFSKEFGVLIIVSFVIATPVAWYLMSQWLGKFAYRIEPGMVTMLTGIAMISVVVAVTVGAKSYKAAAANPVDALRDE